VEAEERSAGNLTVGVGVVAAVVLVVLVCVLCGRLLF
jgi:hypothetical protein